MQSLPNDQVVHSYYIANSGWLFGLLPINPSTGDNCTVVKIGPNISSFDPATRKLYYREGQKGGDDGGESRLKSVILPLDKAEKSKTPNLFEKTNQFLSHLALP